MAFDLNIFENSIAAYGVSSPNKFDVAITLPNMLQNFITTGNNQFPFLTTFQTLVPLRALTCSTPGIALMSNETNKLGVGPRIKQAYNAAFPEVRMSFIADSSGIIEDTFTVWLNAIYNYSFDGSTFATFLANYRSDVVSEGIQITKYDRGGKTISIYTLADAIPTLLQSQVLDWENGNALNLLTISFHYTSYTIQ